MKYHAYHDVFTGLYHTTLLGGEFGNCHGQGSTEAQAVISLRLVVRIRRKKQQHMHNTSQEVLA